MKIYQLMHESYHTTKLIGTFLDWHKIVPFIEYTLNDEIASVLRDDREPGGCKYKKSFASVYDWEAFKNSENAILSKYGFTTKNQKFGGFYYVKILETID